MTPNKRARAERERLLRITEELFSYLKLQKDLSNLQVLIVLDLCRLITIKTASMSDKPITAQELAMLHEAMCAEKDILDSF